MPGEGIHARAVVAALVAGAGDLPACGEAARDIEADLSAAGPERESRALVERLVLLAGAAALRECAPPIIGDIFARTRLTDCNGGLFGTSANGRRRCGCHPATRVAVVINPSQFFRATETQLFHFSSAPSFLQRRHAHRTKTPGHAIVKASVTFVFSLRLFGTVALPALTSLRHWRTSAASRVTTPGCSAGITKK